MPTDDLLIATLAFEDFEGGDGNDTVDYRNSTGAVKVDLQNNVAFWAFADHDTFSSIENVTGSDLVSGRDWLYGDANINILSGLAGDDILEGGGEADIIDGGDGWDYSRYTRSLSAVQINLATGVHTGGDAAGDTLISIEAIVGSAHDDSLIGDNGNNYLRGDGGNDYLSGGHGWDKLLGGQGDDTYVFTSGFYTLTEEGTGIDRVVFDPSWRPDDAIINGNVIGFENTNNTITFNNINLFEKFAFDGFADMDLNILQLIIAGGYRYGTDGDDLFIGIYTPETFNGVGGNDTVDYSNSAVVVKVDLLNDTGVGGDAQGDHYISIENVKGTNNAAFRDTLYGDGNDNALYGQAGDDFLEGGAGADLLDGGAGWDYARYTRSASGIDINLTTGVHTGGDAEGDTLTGIEAIVASGHNDTLRGGAGHDNFWGGNGEDTLYAGLGQDQLYGQDGSDIFVFEAVTAFNRPDLLRDFSIPQADKIDISDLLSGYDALTDLITDFVQITDNGSRSFLAVDIDGGADNFVQIATIYTLGLTDEEALETSGTLITV